MKKPKLVVSSGAGISRESGIKTFRDADGLWENYPVMEVCSADGFRRNPELIHKFYNERRRQLIEARPNAAHAALVELEKDYDVYIITQNVDDLHERAGSEKVLHLHGELMKMRSISHPDYTEPLDIEHLETTPETRGKNGDLMRPHIVFFQEPVPNMEAAAELAREADVFVVVGTSLVVYPAASLLYYVRKGVPIYYIDPRPAQFDGTDEERMQPEGAIYRVRSFPNLTVIKDPATRGMKVLAGILDKNKK